MSEPQIEFRAEAAGQPSDFSMARHRFRDLEDEKPSIMQNNIQ